MGEMGKTEAADAASYHYQIVCIAVHWGLFYGSRGKNTLGILTTAIPERKFNC
jgi:hypothetical protein